MSDQHLGKYKLLEKLGAGATAEVYHARDETLGRELALKILKPALVTDADSFQRFMLEARAAANLFHPHIATVLDIGEERGRYFIAMRYIDGLSLDKIIAEEGKLPVAEVVKLAAQIADALDYAHHKGFLHRDVKPSNILRDVEGEYWVTDFGLTKAMMSTGLTTHTGAVLGTPPYIAPEVWLGEEASPGTDQYALACVVAEALTGEVLFKGNTPPAVMTAHVLKGADLSIVPVNTRSALECALSKEPENRYPDLSIFAQGLIPISPAVVETLLLAPNDFSNTNIEIEPSLDSKLSTEDYPDPFIVTIETEKDNQDLVNEKENETDNKEHVEPDPVTEIKTNSSTDSNGRKRHVQARTSRGRRWRIDDTYMGENINILTYTFIVFAFILLIAWLVNIS
jgi:serine/threonine protein kinase